MKVDVSFLVKRKKRRNLWRREGKKITWATYWISTVNKEKFRSKTH